MANPKALQKQTILDDLVNQFSDPLSFFRELIQNSIDAGSGQIDVYFEFDGADAPDSQGTMIAHVDDFGEGMNREIIETKLTRLFSSAKDDDYTKIGRFGIGFVSVFAIEPDAVCVDTGRTGQSWRVLFDAERAYELFSLDYPIEGTQIRIIKQMRREEFDSFVAEARQVILRWCKHVPAPIHFEGDELGEPFDIDSPCKLTHQEEGTRMVMGLVDDLAAPFGYYNRGLTLKEGSDSPWPHVAFKIDSRYLEHTLTRDQILEDRNFHKAWALLEKFATERLPERLVDQFAHSATEANSPHDFARMCELLERWLESGGELTRSWRRRIVFPTVDDDTAPLKACRKHADRDRLLIAANDSALLRRLPDDYLVVRAEPGSTVGSLLSHLVEGEVLPAQTRFAFGGDASSAPIAGAEPLVEQLDLLLAEMGSRPAWIGFKAYGRPSGCADRLAVLFEDRFEPVEITDLAACSEDNLLAARHVVLNLGDVRVRKLVRIAEAEPEWAAMTLLKLLLLNDELRPELDSLLVTRAIEERKQRRGE